MNSDHFDGKRYYNKSVPLRKLKDLLRLYWQFKPSPWPQLTIQPQQIAKKRLDAGECSVTFINHSTVLLQLEGWNILTDPIWSKRASPFQWAGPKRAVIPGVNYEDLPPIDIVLISHNHYDHMDLPTLRKLAADHQPTMITTMGNKKYLASKGIEQVKELDWWDSLQFSLEYTLHCVPAQHFSSRTPFDFNRTLWAGFVIKSVTQMIYFAGDTAYGDHFTEIRKRLGKPTLSMVPIGVYIPRWFMKTVHMSPEEAVAAHIDLGAKQSMGIHFGTFQLSEEGMHIPAIDLHKALKENHLSEECFWVLNNGESKKVF